MLATCASPQRPDFDSTAARGVVYHGTDADFDHFEFTEDIGFHFGSRETAEKRLLMIGDGEFPVGANLRPVILDASRSLRLPDLHDWNPQSVAAALLDTGIIDEAQAETPIIDQEQVAAWLAEAGFDSIVYGNATELGGDSWIVFRAEQISPWWSK